VTTIFKKLTAVFVVLGLVVGGLAIYGQGNPAAGWHKLVYYSPCQQPRSYRIGSVDPKFNLPEEEFKSGVMTAANIWGGAYGQDLFVYDPRAELTVNLVFDSRQSLTNEITSLESDLKTQKNSLDPQIVDYERRVAAFKKKLADLNSQIEYWNGRGGAPPEEYDKLKNEQQSLKQEAEGLNAMAIGLKQSTQDYNQEVGQLNQTITVFNEQLQYRPEEGIYDGRENKIDIYFNISKNELIHTLAHEFGHALGLGHIQNPKAIMFSRTNQIVALSPDDQAALAEFCRERSVGEMLQKRLQSVSDLYLGGKVFTFSH